MLPTTAGQPARAGRKEWTALGVLLLPLLLVSMDVSVLYFAVPFIAQDLQPTATQQLWIFDVYGFVLAGLLLTMGSLGDRIGRRRLLLMGTVGFAGASVAAAYSGSAEMLIASRALLGVAGATLMPSTLALIRTMFGDERQRGKAIAIWTAVMSGGVALGPVLSGVLLEHFWWGSVFLINLPAMALLLVLGPVLLPEHRSPDRRVDPIGAVLSLAAVLGVTYGVKQWAADGFATVDALCIAGGVLLAAAFVWRLFTARHPMLDVALFRRPGFGAGVVHNVVAMFALVGNATLITQYLQSVLGLSPLTAALWSIAPSVLVAAAAPVATVLGARFGRPRTIAVGFVVAGLGFLTLTQAPVGHGLPVALAVGLVGAGLIAVGIVSVLTLVTEAAMIAIDPSRAGAATAVLETGSEFGGALGIAVLGSVAAAVYRGGIDLPTGLTGRDAAEAGHTLGGALAVAGRVADPAGLISAAREAFVSGMHVADLVGAGVLLLAALVTVWRSASRSPEAGSAEAGSTDVRFTESGSAEVGSAEVRSADVRSAEVRSAEVRYVAPNPAEVRSAEVGVPVG